MKVLMQKDVAKVGQRGTVKEVSDGYALNYLIPNGLAIQATPDKVAAHAAAEKNEADAKAMQERAVTSTIKSIEGAWIEIKARATEKGGLFKAVTASDIAKAILDQRRAKVAEECVMLEKPLKEVGEHAIKIRASGAEARITLAIVAIG